MMQSLHNENLDKTPFITPSQDLTIAKETSTVTNSLDNLNTHTDTFVDSQITFNTITLKGEVWADNWFALYVDQNLIIEDSIPITTERSFNSEIFTFDVTYPINLNFIVKDFKEDDTGLEYIGTDRQQMGDGGFIAQFTNIQTNEIVAVTDQNVQCIVIHQAPLNRVCVSESNPISGNGNCNFISEEEPFKWKESDFDNTLWSDAVVYSENQVQPKEGYDDINWDPSAKLIWSDDLEIDNTLLCKITIEGSQNESSVIATNSETTITQWGDKECIRVVGNAELIKCDDEEIIIESNGIPEHDVMIGIAQGGWNGQWPEEQDYVGINAFMLPGTPIMQDSPTIVVGNAAGVAANGIPIFLPQSPGKIGDSDCLDIEITNDGIYGTDECIRDPVTAGEMDECGGHTGRGNDYHYHSTPKCLIEELYESDIAGYMMDGIPIYAIIEDDSEEYDECGGYISPNGDVYYAFTDSYPYVTNCLLGEFDKGPRTEESDVDTGGIRDKEAGSIVNYYVDGDGCANMSFSGGKTIIHCFDHHQNPIDYSEPNSDIAKSNININNQFQDCDIPPPPPSGSGNPLPPPPPDSCNQPMPELDDANTSYYEVITVGGNLILSSSAISDDGIMPKEYTCDGSSSTIPLSWSDAPDETSSFALIMHHSPGPGDVKWYWILYGIPYTVNHLDKNDTIGVLGTNVVNGETKYAPPCSSDSGTKEYSYTLYALSDDPEFLDSSSVNMEVLLNEINNLIIESATLTVTYERS